jgi:beta-xylosidase
MNAADPDVLIVDNKVWVYPTSGAATIFYAYSSSDLVNWQAYPILDLYDIPWMPADRPVYAWAPGIIEKNGMYYLYYTVGNSPCYIGVAYSSSPSGPFIDKGEPLLTPVDEPYYVSCDAMVFTDPQSEKTYLYSGTWGTLRVFELNSDMLSLGDQIFVETPTNFTEGAFMHFRNGIYYLSYSDGYHKDDTYSVHYSTSSSPVGPWTYRGEILGSDGWYKGPGHHSFLYNAAMDEWYIFYHRRKEFDAGPYTTPRYLCIERIEYNDSGLIKPVVQTDIGVGPVWLGNSLLGDFTGDNVVDYKDLRYFCQVWLSSDTKADIQPIGGNNIVDILDFTVFTNQW